MARMIIDGESEWAEWIAQARYVGTHARLAVAFDPAHPDWAVTR